MKQWNGIYATVPRPNVTVSLCLDPARLHQVLIRPVHRGATINDILPILTNVHYMTLIIVNLHYYDLKTNKSHLT